MLILADDARDATQVRLLLPLVGSALLVTSRQRFVLDGMRVVDLGRLDADAAVALLRGICARLDEAQAGEIARLCGYLPLALRASAGILLNDTALTPERHIAQLKQQPLAALHDPRRPGAQCRGHPAAELCRAGPARAAGLPPPGCAGC
ncbi:MAG: hypothetical protein OHK0022_08900 [Roseiflexaceae bacterium]